MTQPRLGRSGGSAELSRLAGGAALTAAGGVVSGIAGFAVTAVVGIFLGIGRAIVTLLGDRIDVTDRDIPIFVFLAIAAVVLTFPLVLAALLKHHAVLGIGLILLLTGLITVFELPLLQTVAPGPGPNVGHFIALNAFAASSVLVVLGIVRWCGYSLDTPSKAVTS